MEAVQIGPFYVNWGLLTFLVSALAGYFAVSLLVRRSEWSESGLADIVFNSIAIGIAVWKLAPFLYQPTAIWRAPLKIVLSSGGAVEIWIGLWSAAGYVIWRTLSGGLKLQLTADAFGFGMAVFAAVQALVGGWQYGQKTELPWGISLGNPNFAYHPINVYELAAALLLGAIYWRTKMLIGEGRAGRIFFIYGGAAGFAISIFDKTADVVLIFTQLQWICLLMMGFGLFLPRMYILWEVYQERRGIRMATNDSKAQERQEQENKQAKQSAPETTGGYDKKLDGPNRPAE